MAKHDDFGKLLVFGRRDELVALKNHLLKLSLREVQSTKIQGPSPPYKDAVLCIYCNEPNADVIWASLQQLGVKRRIWKYGYETEKDWEPMGRLRKLNEQYRPRRICTSCLSSMNELPSNITIVEDSSLCDYCGH